MDRRKVRFGKDVSIESSSGFTGSDESDKAVMLDDYENINERGRGVLYGEEAMGMYSRDYNVEYEDESEEDDSRLEISSTDGWIRQNRLLDTYSDMSMISELSQGELSREIKQAQRDIIANSKARNFHVVHVGGKLLITDLRPKEKKRNVRHHKRSGKTNCGHSPHRRRNYGRNRSPPSYCNQRTPEQDDGSEVYMESSFVRQNFEDRSFESTQGEFNDEFFVPNTGRQQIIHEQITEDHYVSSSSSGVGSKSKFGTSTAISRITRSRTTISVSSENSSVSSLSQKTGNNTKSTFSKDGLPVLDEEANSPSESMGRWQKTAKALELSQEGQASQFFASDNWYNVDDVSDNHGKRFSSRKIPFRFQSVLNTGKWIKNRRYSSKGPKKVAGRVGRFFSKVFTRKPSQSKPQERQRRKSRFTLFYSLRNRSKNMSRQGRKTNMEELSIGSSISSKNQTSLDNESISVEIPSKSPLSTKQLNDFDITTDGHSVEKNTPKESAPSPETLKVEEQIQTKASTKKLPRYSIQEPDQPSLTLQKHLKKIGVKMNSLESIQEGSSTSFTAAPYLSAKSRKNSQNTSLNSNQGEVNPNRSLLKKQSLRKINAE